MHCDVTQHFLSLWRQIDAIHCNLISFDVLSCFDRFDVKSMQLIVIWSLCNLSCFDRFEMKSMQFIVIRSLLYFCVVLNVLRRNSTFGIDLTSNRCKFIVIWCLLLFCVVLMSNRCKFIVIWSLFSFGLFWVFCDVTQHFWMIWHQIDANSS